MRRTLALFLALASVIISGGFVYASTTNGTIGPTDSLACLAANVATNHCTALLANNPTTTSDDGYINFGRYSNGSASAAAAVHVTDTQLTGFAFGDTVGWINLNCDANGGMNCGASGHFKVANDGTGVLSGFAFGQNTGWISFNCDANGGMNCVASNHFKVTIDSNGNFNGFAWSQNYGYIKFDCSSGGQAAGACVNTDWRASGGTTTTTSGTTGTTTTGSSGGSGGGTPTAGSSGSATTNATTATTTGTAGTTTTTSGTSTSGTSTTATTSSASSTSGSTSTNGSASTTSGSGTAGTTTSATNGTSGGNGTVGTSGSGASSSSSTSSTGSSTGTSGTGASGSGTTGSGTGILQPITTIIQQAQQGIQNILGSIIPPNFGTTAQSIIDTGAKTVTAVGAAVGLVATLVSALAVNPLSLADLLTIPLRLWSLLLAFLGLRKKPWGVVYDSVTKQPLDPVYVILKDAAGNDVGTSITDLDGRYGFQVKAGTYTITAGKTNYAFPSVQLAGKTSDEVYSDLYFGAPIVVEKDSDVIARNIPMDPTNFDWNEFAKRDQSLMNFYGKNTKLFSKITRAVFYIGFFISTVAVINAPTKYNAILFGLYIVIGLLRRIGIKAKSFGGIVEKATKKVIPFAIIRFYSAATNVEVAHKISDAGGQYYALIGNGTYYTVIEKKNVDGTYTKVLTTPPFTVTNGIVNQIFEI